MELLPSLPESGTIQRAAHPPLVIQPRAGEKPAVVSAGAEDDQVRGVHYLSACGPAGIKLPEETSDRFSGPSADPTIQKKLYFFLLKKVSSLNSQVTTTNTSI